MRLLDLSENNGWVNWDAMLASGVSGSICKLTEGAGRLVSGGDTDAQFANNWANARRLGAIKGAYHFARPDLNSADVEAHWFLDHMPNLDTGDLVALDMEYPTDSRLGNFDFAGWSLEWCRVVERALGWPPLLYSYPYFIVNRLANSALTHYPLWLASYDSLPQSEGVWPIVTLWQDTWLARIPGVSGTVDEDVIARDRAGVLALGKPARVVAPPVVVPPIQPPVVTPPVAPPPPTGDKRGTIITACAMKITPDHMSRAMAHIPAHEGIAILNWQHVTANEKWVRIRYGTHGKALEGWVLAANIKPA